MATYVPYIGGAGPTAEHRDENAKALAELVSGELIIHDENGMIDPELVVVKNGRRVVYDRWGWVSLDEEELDQASLDDTFRYLMQK